MCEVDKRESVHMVRLRLHGEEMPPLALRIVRLLMDQNGGCLPLVEMCARYRSVYGTDLDLQMVQDELVDYVQVTVMSFYFESDVFVRSFGVQKYILLVSMKANFLLSNHGPMFCTLLVLNLNLLVFYTK